MGDMTSDEFKQVIAIALNDISDHDGEFATFVNDGREFATKFAKHDVTLAKKVMCVVAASEDLVEYIKSRGGDLK